MGATKVVFTVAGGSHSGKQFVFRSPTHCVAGRAGDCAIRFAGAFEDCLVSRHHCEIDIDPPFVRVRDLGSRNGTSLNGQRIGRRDDVQMPDNDTAVVSSAYELHDGDVLRVGPIPFQVAIQTQPEADREA